MKTTGRRFTDEGCYWITYPDGRAVQLLGPGSMPLLSEADTLAEFMRAHVHDELAIAGLKMRIAHRVETTPPPV